MTINLIKNINEIKVKEHFSLPDLDPMKILKEMVLVFVFYLIKICIFGYIIYFMYKQTNLLDDKSIKNYFIFFFLGSIGLYILTLLYLMYRCYNNGVSFSDMDFKGYALGSLLAPSFILSYIIFIIIASFIKVTPLIGFILYAFITMTILIILSTGIAYNTAFEFSYMFIKCSKPKPE